MKEAILKEIEQAMALANLAKAVAKNPGDAKLQTQMLSLARAVTRGGKNLDLILTEMFEMFESIREIANRP